MKKRNMAALALLAVMLLTACGRAADASVTMEEIVVPEMSSKDMLVNSLEYLLKEEPEEEIGEEQETEEEAQKKEPQTEADQETPDEDHAQEKAVICYGRDMESGLTQEEITSEEITPDVLLNALARHNIVPLLDSKALSMEEREVDGRKLLYLDLSGSFREYLMTMSAEAECIIISSIVNTFVSNYDADAVYITVEGKTLITSNAEYTEALSGDTPGEIMAYLTAAENETEEDAAEPEEE
ncbi:MAG: GerMN domain-containing protein [Lachnospiraceae bacterium]|nr:GerMN domain-containing protein [Lachnospiraceae bacterium]